MFVLQKIRETAANHPRKLALVFNGAPLSYGRFWRLIDACRRTLAEQTPDHGIGLVLADSLLECWIVTLALWARGLDTSALSSPEQIPLFEGQDVACLVTIADEGKTAPAPAGAARLVMEAPSRLGLDTVAPAPTVPDH